MEGRVLIVDPDASLRNKVQEVLSDLGLTVYTAGSFDEAHSFLSFYKIDHMIMDLILPDKNGIDLLIYTKQVNPSIKVYVYTDVKGATIERSVLKKGADAFINKSGDFRKDFDKIFFEIPQESVSQVEQIQGFKGTVAGVDIIDMVQALALMGKSVLLSCRDIKTFKEGIIVFKNGEIVDAKSGSERGKEALFDILSWKDGVFETKAYSEEPQRTINEPVELLLLNFARLKDEAEDRESRVAELTLADILKFFHAEIPGFIGSMIFDYEDGVPIAYETILQGKTFQASAALYGGIMKAAQEAMEIVTEGKEKRDELSEIIISDKNDHVMLFPLPVNNFAIFLLVSRDTSVQEVRSVILKYIPDVIKVLKEKKIS
ncbi:MAG TPA: response regulator [Candidatus Hydrothermia bacterium]|nr:response regulator [Candidatus Hydrothermae bacterium]MDD3648718.1 response regulator [Candidatus Hydrothermia bacterium]HOP32685.1 response regulator [Candidatus Hydrothermia bacterium]HRD23050.1 response regulator [Candidatus Hydrothermia bacterium]